MNPWKLLFQSRKFWLAVTDVVISTIVLIVTTYFKASADFIIKLIAIYQPLFLVVIAGIAAEDVASKNAGNPPPVQ